jgi:hypothetical protein
MTRNEHHLENDIRDIVHRTYGTPQRQASDACALVVLALFIGTVALLARLLTT